MFTMFDSMKETNIAPVRSNHDKVHTMKYESAMKEDHYMEILINTITFIDDTS